MQAIMESIDEERRDKEEKNVEEGRRLEKEWKAERDRRLEDSIDIEEEDKSPTFKIISRASDRIHEYERQSISIDPGNFAEVVKEEIRQYLRSNAGIGCPHPERLHKLEELGSAANNPRHGQDPAGNYHGIAQIPTFHVRRHDPQRNI